jgi:hypothetical protein
LASGGAVRHARDMDCTERTLAPPDLYGLANAVLDAFRRNLDLKDSDLAAVNVAVFRLAFAFAEEPWRMARPKRRRIGRAAAKQECDDVADLAGHLAERLEQLSDTVTDVSGALDPRRLRDLAAGMRSIEDFPTAVERGRPTNEPAIRAAAMVVGLFEQVTGSDADKAASGSNQKARGVEPLMRDVFSVLCIKANAKAAIEAALKRRAE